MYYNIYYCFYGSVAKGFIIFNLIDVSKYYYYTVASAIK